MKHYHRGYAKQYEPPEWVSQKQAANELNIHWFHVALLIVNQHLVPAETSTREMGVTRSSLDQELEWRATSSTGVKLRRIAGDSWRWVSILP